MVVSFEYSDSVVFGGEILSVTFLSTFLFDPWIGVVVFAFPSFFPLFCAVSLWFSLVIGIEWSLCCVLVKWFDTKQPLLADHKMKCSFPIFTELFWSFPF